MNNPQRLKKISEFLYFGGLVLLAVSIPLSKFTISISLFMLAGGWVIGGDIRNKLYKFFTSPLPVIIVSVYFMHLAGLIYSSNMEYALKDLRIKLPLLILPLIIYTSHKLSSKQFEVILLAVVAGVVVSTLAGFLIYIGVIQREITDIRDICIFISHIRLALMCCISIFISCWFIYRYHNRYSHLFTYILVPVIIWLVYFIFLIQSLTGIMILGAALFLLPVYLLIRRNSLFSWVIAISIAGIFITTAFIKLNTLKETFEIKENIVDADRQSLTPSGNRFITYSNRHQYENGYPVWAYVCEEELETQWNKRSRIGYNQNDMRDQHIRFTLIRFLTSKGLKKDSAAVWALNSDEVAAIENGIANVIYLESNSLNARLHQVYWEFNNREAGGNPSGHSIVQRLEYWNVALSIIKKHPLFGVGTGDIADAFDAEYKALDSVLRPEWRLRSHNQYLSMAVAFGITGLMLFLFSLIFPLVISIRNGNHLYLLFALTSILSMLTEDTLETQAGITFFVFFTCLFLFVNPQLGSIGGNQSSRAN